MRTSVLLGIGVAIAAIAFCTPLAKTPSEAKPSATPLPAAAYGAFPIAKDKVRPADHKDEATKEAAPTPPSPAQADSAAAQLLAKRLESPYTETPLRPEDANIQARASTVNVLCSTPSNIFSPLSGSGVVVDPRGVILTNAHVAQYVLLQDFSKVAIDCLVRTGSPAKAAFRPHILYISPRWVREHAPEIHEESPSGTGENDVALLFLEKLNETEAFPPALPVEKRENASFSGDPLIVTAYPAGFAGGMTIYGNLSMTSAATSLGTLYTFRSGTVDLFSLGGLILAQSGSSGGAVVNMWGKLVGIVTTSSIGASTAERDLRALSTAHINAVFHEETGRGIGEFLVQDLTEAATSFESEARELAGILESQIIR